MYLDLDPKRWPSGSSNLLDNGIIKKILTGVDDFSHVSQSLEHNDGEYLIDSIEDVHANFPLIDDADSSQHSALIDALKGKSLVIEGPPGTGKSQTITNLIAAAISQGKKVLFVAEKQAALEVVYNRLNKVGLSDFCLELHSHKSQKNKVLKDVNKRIKKHKKYPEPKEIYSDIQYYEKNKNILNEYSEKVNKKWKNTGKSPAEVFIASVMYTAKINFDPTKVSPDINSLDRLSEAEIFADNDQIDTYSKIYKRVIENSDNGLNINNHPWFGVDNCEIHFNDLNSLEEAFRTWQSSLVLISSKFEKIKEFISTDNNISSFEDIYIISEDLARIPDLAGNEYLNKFEEIEGDNLLILEQYLDDFLKTKDLYKSISFVLDDSIDASIQSLDQLIIQRDSLLELAPETQSLDSLNHSLDKVKLTKSDILIISTTLDKIKTSLGLNFNDYLTLGDLEKYIDIIQLVSKLEPSHFSLRTDLFDQEELDLILPKISNKIIALGKNKKELSVYFELNEDPSLDLVRVLKAELSNNSAFKVFNKSWRQAKSKLISLSNGNIKDFNILFSNIEPLESYLNEKDLFVNDDLFSRLLGPLFDGVNTDINSIISVRSCYSDVRKKFGFGFSPNASIGRAIIDIDLDSWRAIRSLSESGFSQKLANILDVFKFLRKALPLCSELNSKNSVILSADGLIDNLNDKLSQALSILPSLNRIKNPTISDLSKVINNLTDLKNKVAAFGRSTVDVDFFDGSLRLNYSEDNMHNLSILTNTFLFASCVSNEIKNKSIANFIRKKPEYSALSELKKLGFILNNLLKDHEQKYKVFQEKVNLNYEKWCFSFGQDLNALIEKNDKALSEIGSLSDWIAYVREREILVNRGYLNLIEIIESGDLLDVKISDAYKAGFFDLLARQILKVEPDLARFSKSTHSIVQDRFREYDKKLQSLQRDLISWKADQVVVPNGNAGGKVSTYSELSLLRHECGLKRPRTSIRKLIERAGQALLTLKPCFMMGPISVSQYLTPGQFEFDMVIMDEASQIKPEDALGVIARGKQLIVVGDPKQLPPSNFFNSVVEDLDDDQTAIEESDSILDAATPIFNTRRLKWHYRSQHPSLISFSNHSFYNNDLILFPSTHSDRETYGIKYDYLPDGCFVNQQNLVEANHISEAVRDHLINNPSQSLGVVAMSSKQKSVIEGAIESLAKSDGHFQSLLEINEMADEPLFVKNLENVQGDERDVIFISFTYGPATPGGRVFQRFGPINSDVGWRRLNVLFTRSKQRMRVFTSMQDEDILTTENSSRGVQALRGFLSFCRTGTIIQTQETGREPDSDFEVAVISALDQAGFECVPQVGESGYYIDIAVRDPGKRSRYLMAIECDGATYHSAKSARDRDRLRQENLERLGWRVRRIWP